MSHSLLNPYQIRSYDIDLCDDCMDRHRPFGMTIPDPHDTYGTPHFLPFKMKGTFAVFETYVPSDDDIATLPRLELTSDATWNPSELSLLTPQKEEESLSHVRVSSTSSSRPIPTSNATTDEPVSERELFDEGLFWDRIVSAAKVTPTKAKEARLVGSSTSVKRHSDGGPSAIQRAFRIPDTLSRLTMRCTTQHYRRTADGPLTRRYRTDFPSTRYRRLNNLKVYGDVFFPRVKSLKGNTMSFLWTDGRGFAKHYPSDNRSEQTSIDAYHDLIDNYGIPGVVKTDGGGEYVGKKFQKAVRETRAKLEYTEPYSPWQNEAERDIGDLKTKWDLLRREKNVPSRLWDYGVTDILERRARTARKMKDDWRTPLERITGDTPDISEYIDFGFFDLVYYWDNPKAVEKEQIGWWVGVAHDVGSLLCYWILDEKGHVKARTTVQHIPDNDRLKPDIKKRIEEADKAMRERLDDTNHILENGDTTKVLEEVREASTADWADLDELYDNDKAGDGPKRKLSPTPEEFDELIGAIITQPDGDSNANWRVLSRKRDENGDPVGTRSPLTPEDTREYILQADDGRRTELTANTIIENMYAQVDGEGRKQLLLDEIIDHRKDDTALTKDQATIRSHNGNVHQKKTTRGWWLQAKFKDESTSWIPLHVFKDSNPIEVAEYAVNNQISEEPAFAWWVHSVLQKRNRIISKVKSRYWRTTHKFGIELPKTVEEALKIDERNGNHLWRDAIEKEMARVRRAFEPHENVSPEDVRKGKYQPLLGFQEMKCHMVFDIKMDGKFTRKARLVAGGHMVDADVAVTYSSVVSRDSVRIAFLVAALNDCEVYAADVENAYINADTVEKIWCVAGAEFNHLSGTVMKIVKALYGLASSGACWSRELSECLHNMGFESSKADPNVWLRKAARKGKDGTTEEYYEYMLVYVDDLLLVTDNPKPTFDAIMKRYSLKGDGYAPPERYLGANIEEFEFEDGYKCWSMSARDYVLSASEIVKEIAAKHGYKWRKPHRPWATNWKPELETSRECNDDEVHSYQQVIGMLRWAVELGRVDIHLELSQLSQYNACPRIGHLMKAFEVFNYLHNRPQRKIVFDARPVNITRNAAEHEWTEFYRDAKEAIPSNRPEPRGKAVNITCFVDADHAGNSVTRRSHTGFVIYVNGAPIIWYSKRQNTVEASTFGSEFNAMRIALEAIESLRYKLRMFGIPIDGPADMMCDNNAVVQNSQAPHSTLQKKHNSICYHRVREAVAAGTILVHKESTLSNVADLLTKVLSREKRDQHLHSLVYD